MSASTTQPMAGHANQSAPLGAIAILVGALALGAVGIALGTTYKGGPAAGAISPQAALEAQRKGEIGGSATMDYALRIQRRGEIGGSAAARTDGRQVGRPELRVGPPDPVAQGSRRTARRAARRRPVANAVHPPLIRAPCPNETPPDTVRAVSFMPRACDNPSADAAR